MNTNNNSVAVTSNALGQVVVPSQNNPEYGYIRLEQSSTEIGPGGWVRPSKRSTLIKGKVVDLQSLGYSAGQKLPGKIVIKESLVQSNPANGLQDLKFAGDSGVVCRSGDQPIYRTTEYTEDVSKVDSLIAHTNSEEIKAVNAERKAAAAGAATI